MYTISLYQMINLNVNKNCWVKNNPIWVILATQRWVRKGRTQRWVILTQQVGLLCLTEHAGLVFMV